MFAWMRWLPVIGRLSLESRSLECQFKLLNDQHPKLWRLFRRDVDDSKPQINFDCDSQW